MASQRKEYYLHLCCNDSLLLYPDNEPQDFRVQLPGTLNLQGVWECALINISFWAEFAVAVRPREIYICTDLIKNSYAMDNLYPILKRVSVPASLNSKININFPYVDFTPLSRSTIQSVHMYIIDNNGFIPSFAVKDFYCTLVLRQRA